MVVRHPRHGREVALIGRERFRGKDVLDVGSGDGRLSFDLARVARSVLGVDPSLEAVAGATARARDLGLANLSFAVGAAQHLDVGRRRFDVAIFTWSL
ncbi:MAG: methyltransferase domain-containing protein [Candidatus Limnocylindria bacterium]|nr:methyltransferase domain-containing protein [Candidatus Limnocylindria bacterium]